MEENIMVVDSETTGLEKCFGYDIGYTVLNPKNDFAALEQKHFVIEQTWHNLPLFESAYYANKRPLYIGLMRSRKATLEKWGYVMQEMIRDIKHYNIQHVYAYNSPFDEKVINFNCDWFKTQNPLDNVQIHDIWGFASQFITNTEEYKAFCEKNLRFTDSGNYSGNAETVYQFITNSPAFVEAHMGLMDAQIEGEILHECVKRGADLTQDYKVNKILDRLQKTPYTITVNGNVIHEGEYVKKTVYKNNYRFTEI